TSHEPRVTSTGRPSRLPMSAIAYGRGRPASIAAWRPAHAQSPPPAGHMEFLVNINIALPHGMPDDERQELYGAEAVQAAALAAAGRLGRVWRGTGGAPERGVLGGGGGPPRPPAAPPAPPWARITNQGAPRSPQPHNTPRA